MFSVWCFLSIFSCSLCPHVRATNWQKTFICLDWCQIIALLVGIFFQKKRQNILLRKTIITFSILRKISTNSFMSSGCGGKSRKTEKQGFTFLKNWQNAIFWNDKICEINIKKLYDQANSCFLFSSCLANSPPVKLGGLSRPNWKCTCGWVTRGTGRRRWKNSPLVGKYQIK